MELNLDRCWLSSTRHSNCWPCEQSEIMAHRCSQRPPWMLASPLGLNLAKILAAVVTGPLSYIFYGHLLVVFSNHNNELRCWSQNRNIKSAKPVWTPERVTWSLASCVVTKMVREIVVGNGRNCYLNSVSRSDGLGLILSVGDGACWVACVIRRFALAVGSSWG